jgi:DNA-binding XRE family transcriptional regulator
MTRNIDDVIKVLPAPRRRKIEKRAAALIAEELTLQELRQARAMTQVRLAKSLGVAQKQVSEIEKRTDMHISTLRRSIEAMGGKLSLIAEFPDRAPVMLAGIAAIDSASSRESTGHRPKK